VQSGFGIDAIEHGGLDQRVNRGSALAVIVQVGTNPSTLALSAAERVLGKPVISPSTPPHGGTRCAPTACQTRSRAWAGCWRRFEGG